MRTPVLLDYRLTLLQYALILISSICHYPFSKEKSHSEVLGVRFPTYLFGGHNSIHNTLHSPKWLPELQPLNTLSREQKGGGKSIKRKGSRRYQIQPSFTQYTDTKVGVEGSPMLCSMGPRVLETGGCCVPVICGKLGRKGRI